MKHQHHIVPKHMGGSDHPDNLIELSIEEHAQAHKKLYEEQGYWQDKLAWQGLSKIIGHEEVIAEACRRGRLGKPTTIETKKKLSEAGKGEKNSNWKGGFRTNDYNAYRRERYARLGRYARKGK